MSSVFVNGLTRRVTKTKWETVKEHIAEWYVDDGLTVTQVRNKLAIEHVIDPTEEMLKYRLRQWEYAGNKTNGIEYEAMRMKLDELSTSVRFEFKITRGSLTRLYTRSKIDEQLSRRTEGERKSYREMIRQVDIDQYLKQSSIEVQFPGPTMEAASVLNMDNTGLTVNFSPSLNRDIDDDFGTEGGVAALTRQSNASSSSPGRESGSSPSQSTNPGFTSYVTYPPTKTQQQKLPSFEELIQSIRRLPAPQSHQQQEQRTHSLPRQAPQHPAGTMAQSSYGMKFNGSIPINPFPTQQSSTTYPPYYSPHQQKGQDMTQYQGPQQHNTGYRPEWGYGQPPHMAPGQYPGHPVGGVPQGPPPPPNAQRPGQASSGFASPPSREQMQQVSYVSIPAAQQQKQRCSAYAGIERIYKCGWEGCEKTYGHTHRSKRTPEEERKARKKESDAAGKVDDERSNAAQAGPQNEQGAGQLPQGQVYQSNGGRPSLQPIVAPIVHQSTSMSSAPQATFQGHVATTKDALILVKACLRGQLTFVQRRLDVREHSQLIRSGCVFIFDKDASGIERWKDGLKWSPSRILGNFLVYRERANKDEERRSSRHGHPYTRSEGSGNDYSPTTPQSSSFSADDSASEMEKLVGPLIDSSEFKVDGLVKRTTSVTVSGVLYRLVSYFTVNDVLHNKLLTPSAAADGLLHEEVIEEVDWSENPKSQGSLPCASCGKLCKTRSALKQHETVHAVEKPYACQRRGCNRSFSRDHRRKRHEIKCPGISHTAATPSPRRHRCPTCSKSFPVPSTLKNHETIHTDDKPYSCRHPGCDKRFNLLSNKSRHEKICQTSKKAIRHEQQRRSNAIAHGGLHDGK